MRVGMQSYSKSDQYTIKLVHGGWLIVLLELMWRCRLRLGTQYIGTPEYWYRVSDLHVVRVGSIAATG